MRLHRPHIPLAVRLKVAERMLHETGARIPAIYADWSNQQRLSYCLLWLFVSVERAQLDHDPALCNRRFNARTKRYSPAANDPDYLIYRTKQDHDIKTRVRGEGAQLSDLAIRRKNKRIAKRKRQARRPWPKRKFPKWQRKRGLR